LPAEIETDMGRVAHPEALVYYNALLKFDLETDQVTRHQYQGDSPGVQGWGGEATFAPNDARRDGDEDDGYITVFTHDEETNKTQCQIISAKTMSPTAKLAMPERVPFGFHSW
jgi:carotenoid cleavage dioxygenase-like enzyme